MHQFPRSAVRTGTDWVPGRRARDARRKPNKTGPAPAGQANAPPARYVPDRPGRRGPRRPPPRTAGDRAANLRRIDDAQLARPHDHAGAAVVLLANRPIRRVRPRPVSSAGGPPQQVEISIRSASRRPRARLARGPGLLPAAASARFGASPPANWADSKRTVSRTYADVRALSRCHPAACLANSPALPHAHARHGGCGRSYRSPHNPMCPMEFRRLFTFCPLNSAALDAQR